MPVDFFDVLYTVFRWMTVVRILVLGAELYVCARVELALWRRYSSRPKSKWTVTAAVLAGSFLCVATFSRNMVEDYAYVVLGSECEYNVPYAMRWLVKHGRKSRLACMARANPADENDIETRNGRLYAAMVLAKKDPEGSREVLARVPPFDKPGCGNPNFVFGTNRYAWPVAGTNVILMKWNDGTNQIPYEWTDIVEAW